MPEVIEVAPMQLGDSPQRRVVIGVFCVVQIGLTCASLGLNLIHTQGPDYAAAFVIGVGDSQIVLASVLAACSTFRWCFRLPLALVVFVAGCASHYVCWVHIAYPFLAGEEYLISPLLAFSLTVTLVVYHRRRRAGSSGAQSAGWSLHFGIGDVLLWILSIALLITIARRAVTLTDVSGMYDPWETIDLMILHSPGMVLARVPLLLLAIGLHVLVWLAITTTVFSQRASSRTMFVRVPLLLSALMIGEAVVAAGVLPFDPPWPILPISMTPAWMLVERLYSILWEGANLEPHDAYKYAVEWGVIFLTRLAAIGTSLLLLHWSGACIPTADVREPAASRTG
jgi:hypothetical protein